MNHYVYEITNLINGKKYIGKRSCHCKIDKDKYMGSGSLLKKAFQKYGIENFKKQILEICQTEDLAFESEKRFIENVNAYNNKHYYNISAGGNGGNNVLAGKTKEELEIINNKKSEANKGCKNYFYGKRFYKEENHFYGKKHSEESKEKMKSNRKDISGKNNPMYGRKHTLESRQKISENNANKRDDIKLKQSISHKGKNLGKDNSSSRTVICISTNEVFECIKYASEKYSIAGTSISKCCRGKLNSAGKIKNKPAKWMYYEDFLKRS